MRIAKKLSRVPALLPQLLQYLYFHKWVVGITNTKFDISFTVFRESFLDDQYGLRNFLKSIDGTSRVLFLDVGRNHGFVFFYFLFFMKKLGCSISRIDYIGIDPSPIKFAYFPQDLPATEVTYRLIDKAVIFDQSPTVRLKYGEDNMGNFNVSGSNFEKKMERIAARRRFIEIEVDTLPVDQLMNILRDAEDYSAIIVKIDCKNRTEQIMEKTLDILEPMALSWHVACERDGSSEGRLGDRTTKRAGVLLASRLADQRS
jgi:hypothetical protein